ncbi:MAG: RluA family pseudouridine synthase [Planctomycetota bacterium]|jgi:23S rRNA pseudouridine1911/1915/1917 synthase
MTAAVTLQDASEPAAAFEPGGRLELVVPELGAPAGRLDRWLAARLRDCSRSYVQKLIRSGLVLLDGAPAKASRNVSGGERLVVSFPEADPEPAAVPEDIPLNVVHEDADLLVVDKPAGMATHPSCGHARGTLANAAAGHCAQLSALNGAVRPGIVHRLDLDTSGLLVLAKNDRVHRALSEQFANREVAKLYLAVVHRSMPEAEGVIEKPLGRHPKKRKRQAVLRAGGRAAQTRYRTLESLGDFSLLELRPRTGRTHQLRVHLASCGCPILCDALYGREMEFPGGSPVIRRQALHAAELEFSHPGTGERVGFKAPPPEDFRAALDLLRHGRGEG